MANTALGLDALYHSTGSYNIGIGPLDGYALTTGNSNIDVYDPGVAGESNTIRIGTQGTQIATFIAGIYGETTGLTSTLPVIVDANGQLGTTPSSERFKTAMKPMDKSSESILELKPVTFHYKTDAKETPQYGLIAEEVVKVNPDLVVRDKDGKLYSVRYDQVNAMLLNEFLKEHKAFLEEQSKVQEQQATIVQLKRDLQATASHQQKQIDSLTAGLQKVSAQLELNKPAPQTVLNDQ